MAWSEEDRKHYVYHAEVRPTDDWYSAEDIDIELAAREKELQELRCELGRERNTWCDKPEDRLYHAGDKTWWYRDLKKRPRSAAPPPEVVRIAKVLLSFAHTAIGDSVAYEEAKRLVRLAEYEEQRFKEVS